MRLIANNPVLTGVIKTMDKDGGVVRPYEVFVNPELLMVYRELEVTGKIDDYFEDKKVPCVIHTVIQTQSDPNVVGLFLRNNSNIFASKLRDDTLIQGCIKV